MEDLKKEFIIDKDNYEKERIPELVKKILRYCKITNEGQVMFEEKDLILKDKIKLILIARFLANKLDKNIPEEVSIDEILISIGSGNRDSLITRTKEVIDEGVAKRNSKGKYSILPFYVKQILDKLEKKKDG
jgi:hypothetical protein